LSGGSIRGVGGPGVETLERLLLAHKNILLSSSSMLTNKTRGPNSSVVESDGRNTNRAAHLNRQCMDRRDLLVTFALDVRSVTLSTVDALDTQVRVFGFMCRQRVAGSLNSAEDATISLSAPALAAISNVGNTAFFDVPLLDGTDNVDSQLTVALESGSPVHRYLVTSGQLPGDGRNHHFAHLIVFLRLRIDELDSAQAGVCRGGMVELSDHFDHVKTEFLHLKLLRK
jgi:hypothetical protein